MLIGHAAEVVVALCGASSANVVGLGSLNPSNDDDQLKANWADAQHRRRPPSPALSAFLALVADVPNIVPGAAAPATIMANSTEEVRDMGDKGPGSKGGGKKPKTSTKKQKGAAAPK